jgi:hypothetical protein
LANASWEDVADEEFPGAGAEQSRLWKLTIAAQTEAEADEATAEVAPIIGRAVAAQANAVAALRESRRADAVAAGGAALDRLEEALEKVRELQQQAEQDQTQQERAELRRKYLELAARQDALRGQVVQLTDETPLTRRARAQLRGLSGEQGDIRTEAAALGENEEVAETIVFKQMHDRLDAAAASAREALQQGDAEGGLTIDQATVVTLLEAMAAALDESGRPPEFADQPGGGGGGGGGAGQPLVPPAAELKLLRGVQQSVYDQTRALADTVGNDAPTAAQSRRLDGLATQQRELSGLGERLMESLQE